MILISHIRQFIFCPRIFYFYTFSDIKPSYPEHVKLGVEFHIKQDELLRNRTFAKFKLKILKTYPNFYLANDELCGISDLILECENEIIIIEFKNQNKPILNKGTKLQLLAYSKLASSYFKKPFYRYILCYGNNLKFKIFDVKHSDLIELEKTLKEMNKILEKQNFPDSSANQNACEQCEFKNFCDDRE